MKRTTRNDLRYIKTENLIQQTFRDMILEMDYPQISIKDLTERAMINRKTFYLHYNTLDELLGTLQIELYNSFLKTIEDIKLPGDLEKLMQKLFTFYANTSKANEKILYSRGHFPEGESPADHVREKLFNHFHPINPSSEYSILENNIVNAYLNGSILSIYLQWVTDDRKMPLENVIQLATKLVSQGLNNLPY